MALRSKKPGQRRVGSANYRQHGAQRQRSAPRLRGLTLQQLRAETGTRSESVGTLNSVTLNSLEWDRGSSSAMSPPPHSVPKHRPCTVHGAKRAHLPSMAAAASPRCSPTLPAMDALRRHSFHERQVTNLIQRGILLPSSGAIAAAIACVVSPRRGAMSPRVSRGIQSDTCHARDSLQPATSARACPVFSSRPETAPSSQAGQRPHAPSLPPPPEACPAPATAAMAAAAMAAAAIFAC